MKNEKSQPLPELKPRTKDNPIIDFLSGLAKLGQQRQGIGYASLCNNATGAKPKAAR